MKISAGRDRATRWSIGLVAAAGIVAAVVGLTGAGLGSDRDQRAAAVVAGPGATGAVGSPARPRSASAGLVALRSDDPPATPRSARPVTGGTGRPAGMSRFRSSERPNLDAAQLLAGVGVLPPGWSASSATVSVNGLDRSYLVVQPDRVTSAVPVVVLMHGRNMSPDAVLHISGLAGQTGPAVLLLPAGWHESWDSGNCCGVAFTARTNDVGFIQAALRAVVAAEPVLRSSPVYAVGFSNGGRMAYQLACDLPGVFSAMMAVEAVPVQSCPSLHPMNITVVAQQNDPLLTVDPGGQPKTIGGYVEPTVPATLAHLAFLDRCSAPSRLTVTGAALERSWSCAAGTQLRYIWYPGGTHSWRAATPTTPGVTDYVLQLLGEPQPH